MIFVPSIQIKSKYTFRHLNMDDLYQRKVVRSKLPRNIAASFDPVHDELVSALRDFIPMIDKCRPHTLEERADDLCIAQSGSKYQPCNVSFVESSRVVVGGPLCA